VAASCGACSGYTPAVRGGAGHVAQRGSWMVYRAHAPLWNLFVGWFVLSVGVAVAGGSVLPNLPCAFQAYLCRGCLSGKASGLHCA
jgi:hypothetical protein